MYNTNKIPCAIPTLLTYSGISKKYLRGIAINSNKRKEIASKLLIQINAFIIFFQAKIEEIIVNQQLDNKI